MDSPNLVEVPGTKKTINLNQLFNLIKNEYPDKLDRIDFMAQNIDGIIRFIAESITGDTNMIELRDAFFTLFKLKDIFGSMEIDN